MQALCTTGVASLETQFVAEYGAHMTVDFEGVLARADTSSLSELMPTGAATVVMAIDPQLYYPQRLRKILLALRSPAAMLDDPKARAVLIDLLPQKDAQWLASVVCDVPGDDPYAALKCLAFRQKAQREALFGFFGVGLPANVPTVNEPSETTISPRYPLFPHQITALQKVAKALAEDPRRVLLHMPTGSGKTRTAMNVIAGHLRENSPGVVVWLAHSEELCTQAAEEFSQAWEVLGNRDIRVARFWGLFDSDLKGMRDGIVFAGFPKAYARLRSGALDFGYLSARDPLVVIDEAHQAIAPTHKQIIEHMVRPLSNARLLGLSATPGRTWNDPQADAELSDFFGRRKVALHVEGYDNPVQYLIDQGYLARPVFRRIEADSKMALTPEERRSIEETFDLPRSVLERLGRDHQFNLIVVRETEQLLRKHLRVIVFAASVDQSDLLAAVFQARGIWAASVSSRTSPEERANSIREFKASDELAKVLCNFGVLTTGFDAPRTSAAVVARPTLSLVLYSQMIGRAMRGVRAGGNKEAEIVTVVDPGLPGFGSVESAFSNWEDVWSVNNE